GAALIVHGGPEVFRAIPGARGLHLPWREANKLSARPVPEDVWLGVSCHDRQEIDHATAIGADYVTLGPVQPTESHPGAPTLGWSVFADLVSEAVLPVFALGGLSPGDLREARQRGGQGIAGIRFWWPQS
ncbi:MAG TPA: DNA mismatch repair protein MutT, partial [Marinobacter adhaerens]|nr:DNA mismatch repair protein MutT [Marinobacter adhaerens]